MNVLNTEEHTLSCISINGEKKYDLPGHYLASHGDYIVYFRPNPIIIHFLKNKSFRLDNTEIVLISTHENHVISIAFDNTYRPINMYININLTPEKNNTGYHWIDLEIDIKLYLDENRNFTPILVDVDDYDRIILNTDYRTISEHEISILMDRIFLKKFPFDQSCIREFLCNYLPNLHNQ